MISGWIVGLVCVALFGGGGWLFWQSRSVDVEKVKNLEKENERLRNTAAEVQQAQTIRHSVARTVGDILDKRLQRWRKKR